MPNNFCSVNAPSSLFRIPWIAKQRKTRCSNNFLLCVLEEKSFCPQALPMHSHFAYCSSTSHMPVPSLPGWGLQIPVMDSQFLKPGAHCRGLWNWHRDHPVQYQPGGSQEPASDSSLQSYAVGNTLSPAQSQRSFPTPSQSNLSMKWMFSGWFHWDPAFHFWPCTPYYSIWSRRAISLSSKV